MLLSHEECLNLAAKNLRDVGDLSARQPPAAQVRWEALSPGPTARQPESKGRDAGTWISRCGWRKAQIIQQGDGAIQTPSFYFDRFAAGNLVSPVIVTFFSP